MFALFLRVFVVALHDQLTVLCLANTGGAAARRPDLLNDLDRAVCRTAKTRARVELPHLLASDARRLVDRLGEQIICDLLADRRTGATQRVLAERYGMSIC